MKNLSVKQTNSFELTISNISSDKSISHRCAIFSMLSDKPSVIKNYLQAEDTLNTLAIVQKLGAKVEHIGDTTTITPPSKITEPDCALDCGNSGTAMRLMIGFLSSTEGSYVLVGDKYLHKRPMNRVVLPLKEVGAIIDGRENGNLAPIWIRGTKLKPFNYRSKIASAQVKSAMILSALNANGDSFYYEDELSRDHTERMLEGMGASISRDEKGVIKISPLTSRLNPLNMTVPSDPSSAFFFAIAVAIIPNSRVVLKNILLNKTRIEAFKVLENMGIKITYTQTSNTYETIGDIVVEYAPLNGVIVETNISWLIDEIPALSIAFACANGKSIVKNAKELRVKESDRIKAIVENLKKCGIEANEFEDGFEVVGGEIKSAVIDSFGDHRIAMSFAVAGLKSDMQIEDIECINTSFPTFLEIISNITTVKIDEN